MQVAVAELAGGFEPVEDVEVEVVSAGAAVEEEGQDRDERGDGEYEEVESGPGFAGRNGHVHWIA